MTDALWLLMRMRFVAWFRRFRRNASSIKGALTTAFFVLMMSCWAFGLLANRLFSQHKTESANPLVVQRFGGPGLLAFCILIIVTAGTKPPLLFSPAEIQFLFCGPFTRRQLLSYKLLSQFLMTLPFSVFMSIVFRDVAGSYVTAVAGALLTFTFLQLFGLAVNFTASYFSALAYSRFRKIVLFAVFGGLLVGGALLVQQYSSGGNILQTLQEIDDQPALRTVLAPLRWFSKVVTARTFAAFWPPALGALSINVGLLILVFVLDAKFLETVSTASEQTYARIERLRRSGGSPFQHSGQSQVIRRQVRSFPYWGGIGPIFWRQFVTAQRSRKAFLFMILMMLLGAIGPVIAMLSRQKMDEGVPWGLAGTMLMMSLFVHQFLAFDFRSDIDRIEVLKTLPLPAWRIAVGQLLAPVFFISLIQIVLVSILYALMGKIGLLVLAVVACAVPFNLVLVGIDNFLFLLFPARAVATTPGDFSHAGRQMVLLLGRMIGMFITLLLPALAGGITYLITKSAVVAGLGAWFLLLLVCWLPVPLVAWAFKRFDVARDTPP